MTARLCSRCQDRPRAVTSRGIERSYCPPCASDSKREWRHANPERVRELRRQWHAANREEVGKRRRAEYAQNRGEVLAKQRADRQARPDIYRERGRRNRIKNAEKIAACKRDWLAQNRAHKTAQNRAFREANREHVRDYMRAWVAAHPERRREISRAGAQTRRARLIDAFIEAVDPVRVWERDNGVCHICGLPADPARWDMEHVVPLARGGQHCYANVRVSHPVCNYRKGVAA